MTFRSIIRGLVLISLVLCSVASAARREKGADVPLGKPLTFGKDLVEVTAEGNLRGRYRFWGDWNREFASYLEDAVANAKTRGTPARKLTMGCVFLKNASITLADIKGGDGKPLTGTYSTPQGFVDEMLKNGMKEYSDYMFAFSGGEVEVQWVVHTAEDLHWVQTGTQNQGWGCQPKAVGDQILKSLEKYKDQGVCMWMFCAGKPTTINPRIAAKNAGIGAPPYGISYTQWAIYGGYSLVISAPGPALMVHEFNHRYLDNLQDIEGVHLTGFHGLSRLGFSHVGFADPLYHADYRYTYQYIIPRDMWRRFSITEHHQTPKEPFTGKAYAWDDVKYDCWFKLPELSDADLARLTGINSITIAGDRKSKQDYHRTFTVSAADRQRVLSPYLDQPAEQDHGLNNSLTLPKESCAVLKTPTGQWLMVKKDLADLYVQMQKISARGADELPVYGYINRDLLPLIILKAPDNLAIPSTENAYFRPN